MFVDSKLRHKIKIRPYFNLWYILIFKF